VFPKGVVQVRQEEQVKFGEDGLGGGGVDALVVLERGLEEVGSSEGSTRMVVEFADLLSENPRSPLPTMLDPRTRRHLSGRDCILFDSSITPVGYTHVPPTASLIDPTHPHRVEDEPHNPERLLPLFHIFIARTRRARFNTYDLLHNPNRFREVAVHIRLVPIPNKGANLLREDWPCRSAFLWGF
jgi:hypothetical protein